MSEPTLQALLNRSAPLVFVDVGANEGMFSAAFAKTGAAVYSIEPDAVNFAILRRLADRGQNWHVFDCALSDRTGESILHGGGTLASLDAGWIPKYFPEHAGERARLVQTYRWGDFCKRYGIQAVDILKIDVEGHDAAVLRSVCEDGPWPKSLCIEVGPETRPEIEALAAQMNLAFVESVGLDGERGFYDLIFEVRP